MATPRLAYPACGLCQLTLTQGHIQIIPYVYEYSGANSAILLRGAPINITRWFEDGASSEMQNIIFLSGTEELLLVAKTGLARIFSLVTEHFR